MDIVARLVRLIAVFALLLVAGSFAWLGLSVPGVLLAVSLVAATGYLLLIADTPLRPNRYRPLRTQWAEQVEQTLHSPPYPRPQLQRESWFSLNGAWQYAVTRKKDDAPDQYEGEIQVPFPVESPLSGVGRRVLPNQALWYQRSFTRPGGEYDVLKLHFGGVDWLAEVWVNDHYVGEHRGGHDAFSFDIAPFLAAGDEQRLRVRVWDPTDSGTQPRGKQVRRPGNIYYTPVTGIWQTVWLEPLTQCHITRLCMEADIDNGAVTITVHCTEAIPGVHCRVRVLSDGEEVVVQTATGLELDVVIPPDKLKLWDCDSPNLYDIDVQLLKDEAEIDRVSGYFGMRHIEIKVDPKGISRLYLNHQPRFQLGLLDQGWWPDGLYTAPTDEALRYDIEKTREMGFNMIRKHVKVEPARWYYHCDRLGMLVWQDMPTGDRNILPRQRDITRSPESEKGFFRELDAMLEQLHCFPSIICWVPFNEGWGQFRTNEILAHVKNADPSRLVDGPSGWVDRGEGDMRDYHIYNRKLFVGSAGVGRALVIGEFGGIGYRAPQHMAVTNAWSYNRTPTLEAFEQRYESLMLEQLQPLLEKGLAAAVYTQTTDVESEINGLLTYDRALQKVSSEHLQRIHRQLYEAFTALTKP